MFVYVGFLVGFDFYCLIMQDQAAQMPFLDRFEYICSSIYKNKFWSKLNDDGSRTILLGT